MGLCLLFVVVLFILNGVGSNRDSDMHNEAGNKKTEFYNKLANQFSDKVALDKNTQESSNSIVKASAVSLSSAYDDEHTAILALITSLGNWIGNSVDLSSDHCNWRGISCNNRVINYLSLYNKGLTGLKYIDTID